MQAKKKNQPEEEDALKDYVMPEVKEFKYDISHLQEDDFEKKVEDEETEALKYHALPVPGKYTIVPSKVMASPYDLALAYSPGVAEPCLKI